MKLRAFILLVVAAALAIAAPLPSQNRAFEKPKVRAVTAFVRLDVKNFQSEVADALTMLRKAKALLDAAGYEVQTLRITPQPIGVMARTMSRNDLTSFYDAYAALAKKEGFATAIGPAMIHDGDDPKQAALLAEILAAHPELNGSITVADEDGVHWNGVRAAARAIKFLEETPRSQGNFGFAAAAMVEPYGPFYPASYHIGRGQQFAFAIQGASVVDEAFAAAKGDLAAARKALSARMSEHAVAIVQVAQKIASSTGWTYMGMDFSTAPLKDVSIGAAIEKLTGEAFGSSGTLTAAELITSVQKELPVERVGYNGMMMPILEDARLSQRWSEGRLTVDQMLAYSSVCGAGLDTIPLQGDVTEDQLARIVGDVATLAFKLKKPLTARLMPVKGKKAGEMTEFESAYIVNAKIQPLP